MTYHHETRVLHPNIGKKQKEKGHEAHPAAAHNGLNQHNLQQMHQTLIYRYHYNNLKMPQRVHIYQKVLKLLITQ